MALGSWTISFARSLEIMSPYAILGATGSTGSSILRLLSATPENRINVLVRSKSKLKKVAPSSVDNSNIEVFEGSISDIDTLSRCIAGTRAVFLTVAVVDNQPGCTIAQDTAHVVVDALNLLKKGDQTFKPPRLIVLSSSSVDDKFWDDTPAIVHNTIWNCMSNIYTDLAKAEKYLRAQEDWLSCTFVMPGGITKDVQRGHELCTTRQQTFVSFLDVAAAMIEVADEEGDRWDGQNVSLVLKGGQKAKMEWWAPVVLGKGLILHFFPWMYAYV
ncbi:NAD(P)-binding protein [Ophiobolus disseminans]|uniref:NAD(P)-binding protein n=1 Tax=Ophiobolus disseminans TaxID=1469910 RepID=A0A6A7AIF6_9PLEO|nr:NAD(P)-binding protein [Ophiobolus disseminans]